MITQLEIYRTGIYPDPPTLQETIQIDEKTIYSSKLMGDEYISAEYISKTALNIEIGDYITYNSQNYYIKRIPDFEKLNNNTLKYTIIFKSIMSDAKEKLYLSSDGLAEFSLNGTAEDFIDLFISNMNDKSLGWTKGTIDTTSPITMTFSNEYCSDVLTRVAEQFSLEYQNVVQVINLSKTIGNDTSLVFKYGKGQGLYNLIRKQVQDQNILTRVYGYGSTKNILSDYNRGTDRLVFETIEGKRYLEKNVELYGLIEGQYTNEEIFPSWPGILTSSHIVFDETTHLYNAASSYVEDSSINFDLNESLVNGGQISFKTGLLAGITCDISRYAEVVIDDVTHKRIYFNSYVEGTTYTYPNYNDGSPIQPEIGDTYFFLGISLPQAYLDIAEDELKQKTQTFLDENCVPMIVYDCDIDPKYAKTIAPFGLGDKVTVEDTSLAINSKIRISGIEYPLVNTNKITATIADFVPYTIDQRVVKGIISQKKETKFVDIRQSEAARRNTIRLQQQKNLIFDTDGYFDNTHIKPNSIETLYLAVGTKSSDFWLSGVVIQTNMSGEKNSFTVSTGSLVHHQIQIVGLGYTWVFAAPLTREDLVSEYAYYLYAKCSKSALTAEWVLSDEQISVEEITGYYHFYTGNLFPVYDDRRDFDFVKGMTYIVGDTITSGKITSLDGECYLDLTNAKFRVGNSNSSFDWNVTNEGQLTIVGALVQSDAGTFPLMVFCGVYDSEVTYSQGNQVTYDGSSWNYINATPHYGQTPAEGIYWTAAALKGVNGAVGGTVVLNSNKYQFSYDKDGDLIDTGTYSLSANIYNLDGTLYYQFVKNDIETVQNTTSSTCSFSAPAAYSSMPVKYSVAVRFNSPSGIILANDSLTVFGTKAAADGEDGTDGTDGTAGASAFTVICSNQTHALPADYAGNVSDYTNSGNKISVFYGNTQLSYGASGANTYSVSASGGYITPGGASTSGKDRIFANASNITDDSAYINFTITARDPSATAFTFTKTQTFTKAKAGAPGTPGANGDNGPSPVYRGVWVQNAGNTYYGTTNRVDIVKFGSAYYVTKSTIGGYISDSSSYRPDNTTYWNSFGATFTSVATEFIFASSGSINVLTSNSIKVYDTSGNFIGGMRGATAGYDIVIWAGGSNPDAANFRVDKNGAVVATSATITGTITSANATITGSSVFGDMHIGSGGSNSPVLYVYKVCGIGTIGAITQSSANMIFRTGTGTFYNDLNTNGCFHINGVTGGNGILDLFCGLGLNPNVITSGVTAKTLTCADIVLNCYNTGSATITLPYTIWAGQTFLVKRCASGAVTVSSSRSFYTDYAVSSISLDRGDSALFIWDGNYYHVYKMNL